MNTNLTKKQRQDLAIKLATEAFNISKKVLLEVKPQDAKDYQKLYGDFDDKKALELIQANNNVLNVPYAILVMGNVNKKTITSLIKSFNEQMK